jgi:hypothetical protein
VSNVPIPQDQLDAWARFANHVRTGTFPVQAMLARREYDKADEALTQLHLDAAAALTSLREAGAARVTPTMAPKPVPLELLNTAANRRLAYQLRMALEAAQEVDKERGSFMADEPYEGPCTLPIAERLAKVEQEVFGPAGLER